MEPTLNRATRPPVRAAVHGFTLIEVLVVVAVLGLLAVVAIPNYSQYIQRSNRSEARAALLTTQQNLERFFTANNRYPNDATEAAASLGSASKYTLGGYARCTGSPGAPAAATCVEITATPSGFTDSRCGWLRIDTRGTRSSQSGTVAECWGR